MKRKINLLLLPFIFGLIFDSASVYGKSLSQEVALENQLKQESATINQQITGEEKQAQTVQTQIQAYTISLGNVSQSITLNQQQIQQIQQKIVALQGQIIINQQKIVTLKNNLENVMKTMYNKGTSSYLQFLFNSKSFYDLMQRMNDLHTISSTMYQMSVELKQLTTQLQGEQTAENQSKQALVAKKMSLLNLQNTYQNLKNQKVQALNNLQNHIQNNTQHKNILESQIRLTQQQIQEIHQQMILAQELEKNKQYVQQQQQHLVSASASAIISFAEQFEGLPYVWGGTSPNPGFDCSGFTQYVFAHFGISIPRTSEEQYAVGVPISQNNLQPGDLVFFSTYAPGASHVGIYIGNGLMIDSEDLGVVIDNITNAYWAPKYLGARRFITN